MKGTGSSKMNKKSSAAKKKSKLIAKVKEPISPIHNTAGGKMPNPEAKKSARKDARIGFR